MAIQLGDREFVGHYETPEGVVDIYRCNDRRHLVAGVTTNTMLLPLCHRMISMYLNEHEALEALVEMIDEETNIRT